ncbi:hypothetical protein AB0I53_40365 [Saccharopolyspora sp. NPDC050389]|uniref:hypothetical protein n=1 Tax=Saccharopolyspora sp. NPDC050389 TaxID=3155516 RepID=UPI0033C1905E
MLRLLLGTDTWRCRARRGSSFATRQFLLFASVVTLALNVAEPICAGQFGKAAFDGVGPLLLIGWAEAGPALLQAIATTGPSLRASGLEVLKTWV